MSKATICCICISPTHCSASLIRAPYLFPDSSQTDSQDFVADRFAEVLKQEAAKTNGPELVVFGTTIQSLEGSCST